MIPKFPRFKNLELSDKKDVEKITEKYPPYSDFNFVSMWCWNIKGEVRISILNENLVVKFADYLTDEPFYSFLGGNKVNETAEALLELSKKEGLRPALKLVPEIAGESLDLKKYSFTEDRDHFDYVYKNDDLANFNGKRFHNKRNLCKKFEKSYPINQIVIANELKIAVIKNILKLDRVWAKNKFEKLINFSIKNEAQAIKRFFSALGYLDKKKIIFLCLYVNKKLVGFSISSIINKDYSLCHFIKGDIKYSGVYEYTLKNYGGNVKKIANFVNYEQDLGLSSLRFSKNSFRPDAFLKKYVIIKLQD